MLRNSRNLHRNCRLIRAVRAQAIARLFRTHDKGLVLGPFTNITVKKVINWLESNRVIATWFKGRPVAAVAVRIANSRMPVKDFTGEVRAFVQPGDAVVGRIAFEPGFEKQLLALLKHLSLQRQRTWLYIWQEHAAHRMLARKLGARWVTTKIRASSELIGVWIVRPISAIRPLKEADRVTICRLKLPALDVAAASKSISKGSLRFVDHYSIYNRAHSWSTIALRGYGRRTSFIIKPGEMSKKWMCQNPEKLSLTLGDTPTRKRLRELEPLIGVVPGRKQRIRLMRLAPGGIISRHSDIVDKETGTSPGKFLRIHVPLATNSEVEFTCWDLQGRKIRKRMRTGECWYLDTRKPHQVENRGKTARVHLVMDVESCPTLLRMLN